jgi:hypothetical protein
LLEAAAQFTRAIDLIATLPGTPALRREQIKLQVALINALHHVKGYAAPESKAAVEQARVLIEQAEALTNFMLSRPGEPVGRASPARQPDSNDNRLFLDGKDSRLGFLGACREISDGLTLLPLRDSLLVDPVALSEGFMGLVIVRVVPHSATRAH